MLPYSLWYSIMPDCQRRPIMITIGVLSDTHIVSCEDSFKISVNAAFSSCQAIIHAGDLTDVSILKAFGQKDVYAVCGNMCNELTARALPRERMITLNGYAIGICHGAGGPRHNIEERMFELFPQADCIIYGHTHAPVCHTFGPTLMMNPGSFQSTGRYGSPGTYGLLEIDETGLRGSIHELPQRS